MGLKIKLSVGAFGVAALLAAGLSYWSLSENSQPAASGGAPPLSETIGPLPTTTAPAPVPATNYQAAAPPPKATVSAPAPATNQRSHNATSPPTTTAPAAPKTIAPPAPAPATQHHAAAPPPKTTVSAPAPTASQPSHNTTSPPTTTGPAPAPALTHSIRRDDIENMGDRLWWTVNPYTHECVPAGQVVVVMHDPNFLSPRRLYQEMRHENRLQWQGLETDRAPSGAEFQVVFFDLTLAPFFLSSDDCSAILGRWRRSR
jgi:hypothetical protein